MVSRENKKVANNFPCYEGEDELFTSELREIMEEFKLKENEIDDKYLALSLNTKMEELHVDKLSADW